MILHCLLRTSLLECHVIKTAIKNLLKHKTVKTNDKIRRFGVFMTPLSRKILKRSCKLQHLKRFWREELTKEGAKIVKIYKNTFARMESACTLRFGFNDLIKSISYTKQSNLFLHFLSTLKRSSRPWGIVPCPFL